MDLFDSLFDSAANAAVTSTTEEQTVVPSATTAAADVDQTDTAVDVATTDPYADPYAAPVKPVTSTNRERERERERDITTTDPNSMNPARAEWDEQRAAVPMAHKNAPYTHAATAAIESGKEQQKVDSAMKEREVEAIQAEVAEAVKKVSQSNIVTSDNNNHNAAPVPASEDPYTMPIPANSNKANKDDSSDGSRIYVGGLNYGLSEDQIKELFAPFGPVSNVHLGRDVQHYNRSKGYAFVDFSDALAGPLAIEFMHGFVMTGRDLTVNHSSRHTQTKVDLTPADRERGRIAFEAARVVADRLAEAVQQRRPMNPQGNFPPQPHHQQFQQHGGAPPHQPRHQTVPHRRIHLSPVPQHMTDQDVRMLCESQAGPVVSLSLPRAPYNQGHRGFAFVEFATDEGVAAAYEKLPRVPVNRDSPECFIVRAAVQNQGGPRNNFHNNNNNNYQNNHSHHHHHGGPPGGGYNPSHPHGGPPAGGYNGQFPPPHPHGPPQPYQSYAPPAGYYPPPPNGPGGYYPPPPPHGFYAPVPPPGFDPYAPPAGAPPPAGGAPTYMQ